MSASNIKGVVKERYGQAALRVHTGGSPGCGGGSAADPCCDPISLNLYSDSQGGEIPEQALRASLGCGNPTALASLNPGEIVLDLGSGGGIDVLLSARRVGPTGKAYGLDMTDEMLALAREKRIACCARRFACSSPAGASPSPTWWFAARFRPPCARTSNCGSVASPARSRTPSTRTHPVFA